MSDGFSHRFIIICTVFRERCIFQIYRVSRGHAHIFASRLCILECLISISRYILGFGIIDGLLRDMGAMEPCRLRGGFFAPRRHKPIVLSLLVHDSLYLVINNAYALIVSPVPEFARDILAI